MTTSVPQFFRVQVFFSQPKSLCSNLCIDLRTFEFYQFKVVFLYSIPAFCVDMFSITKRRNIYHKMRGTIKTTSFSDGFMTHGFQAVLLGL